MAAVLNRILGVPTRAGEKGRRIRELTSVVQKRFNFPAETVELYAEKVADRGLCAVAQAESLRYKLLGGLAVRRWDGWSCSSQGLFFHLSTD
jgi:ribosomal protein S3